MMQYGRHYGRSVVRSLAVTGFVAWAGLVAASHECRANVYQKQWIANNTGQKANDLELTFSGPITNVKNSGNPGSGGTTTANTADDYTITGLSINSGTELQLRWGASDNVKPPPTIINPSYWTFNGANIGNVTLMGTPAKITYNQYVASATFTNDSATNTLDYTKVALYADNTARNYLHFHWRCTWCQLPARRQLSSPDPQEPG